MSESCYGHTCKKGYTFYLSNREYNWNQSKQKVLRSKILPILRALHLDCYISVET